MKYENYLNGENIFTIMVFRGCYGHGRSVGQRGITWGQVGFWLLAEFVTTFSVIFICYTCEHVSKIFGLLIWSVSLKS